MSKERLQDIKKKYNYERLGEFLDVKPVNAYELKWLIQQAERVQELEELEQEYVDLNRDFTKLALENKRYREALQHIRDNSNDKVAVFIADRALEESK